MSAIKWAVSAVVMLALAIVLSWQQRLTAERESQALADADYWKRIASKAYVGYLAARSPADADGIVRTIAIPKGSRLEVSFHGEKLILPPPGFGGVSRVSQDGDGNP